MLFEVRHHLLLCPLVRAHSYVRGVFDGCGLKVVAWTLRSLRTTAKRVEKQVRENRI